jgi:sugar phosphate isomerase/epimerase
MTVIAASSYSFHRLVKSGELKLLDAARLAREAGADAIEFALGGSLSPPLSAPMAADLARTATDSGMPITGICIAAELLRGDQTARQAAINAVLVQLEAAASMGVKRFRHDATLGPENGDLSDRAFDEAIALLAPACHAIAEYAAALGIRSSIENHGRFVQHAERVLRLIRAVEHPSFGLTFDIGNSLFAPQDPVRAAALLAPKAITVHVKDFQIHPSATAGANDPGLWPTWPGGPFVRGCIVGEGDLDVPGCIAAVVVAGFEGPFVVEFEGPMIDPRIATARGIENLRALLAKCAATPITDVAFTK